MLKTVSVALLLLVASEVRSQSDESATTAVPPVAKSQAVAEQKGGLRNMSVDDAITSIELAGASGDNSVVIEGLDHRHPATMSAALKILAEKRIKSAMPRLILMYEEFNSPDGGPFFTGGGPFWDDERDPTAKAISSEIVAAIDSITGSVIQKPRDTSLPESRRYLDEVKTWWNANSSRRG